MTGRLLTATALYFGLVFALGFVLGAVRTVALAAVPDVSRLQAVAIEVPVMLAVSWVACAIITRRCSVPKTVPARAMMGGGAFLLLGLAELMLAVWLAGLTPVAHFRSYAEPSHALGLAAQIAFGVFPLIQRGR
ncbi:MAG: hypothetical protein K2X25_14270 [Caulobacteraceae bacterium]|nr:hypothetical protein [Caulobacteraceae bacterium]